MTIDSLVLSMLVKLTLKTLLQIGHSGDHRKVVSMPNLLFSVQEEKCETSPTTSHTHTLCQPADNWQMSGEIGNPFTLHTLFAYIFVLSAYIYLLIFTNSI